METEINKLPSINAGGIPAVVLHAGGAGGGAADDDTPTAHEKTIASKTGIDVKKLVAQRKKRVAESDNGGTA